MKTFFIALILGILIGSLITMYLDSPDAFERLNSEKHALLSEDSSNQQTEPKEASTPEPATPPDVPIFRVAEEEPPPPEEEAENPPGPIEEPETEPQPSTEPELPPETIPEPAEPPATPEIPREKAEALIEGAKETASELTEKAKPYVNEGIDAAIAAAIRAQFKIDPLVKGETLEIKVANRMVTLVGELSSTDAKRRASEIAIMTKGVEELNVEQLQVAEPPPSE